MARASRLMAEYFRSHGSNFRDPKAMGCSSPSCLFGLKPRPESETSICGINILFQSSVTNTGNSVIFFSTTERIARKVVSI